MNDAMKRDVVVVAGCRTAQGTFGGTLRDVPAHELMKTALCETIARARVAPDLVDNVIVGQVYQTSQALNIARFCVLDAGLPFTTSGYSINEACGSSMEAFNGAA